MENNTSKKPRVLYLSEGTSCPEQEWYEHPHYWNNEPYKPYVSHNDYLDMKQQMEEAVAGRDQWRKTHLELKSLKEQCEKLLEALEKVESESKVSNVENRPIYDLLRNSINQLARQAVADYKKFKEGL